ncbi:transposase [Pseudomonas sp. IT-232MI5]
MSEQNLKGTDAPGPVLCIVVERSIVEQFPGRSTRGLAG